MSLRVIDLLVSGLDVPFTPGCDDLHIGCESLYGKLETNLVVSFTGTAVADCVCAFSLCYLNDPLCDNGTCKGGSEEVIALVLCSCLKRRENEVLYELLLKILDVKLGRTGLYRLLLESVKLGSLTDVSRNGDNLTVIVIFL